VLAVKIKDERAAKKLSLTKTCLKSKNAPIEDTKISYNSIRSGKIRTHRKTFNYSRYAVLPKCGHSGLSRI